MKHLIVFGILFLAVACGNQKETTQEIAAIEEEVEEVVEEVEETTSENYRVIGIVHVSETECPLYLETKLENETVSMYPMNLEEKYKREGMKLKFDYELSRGAQPENCDVDMVVSMSDVTLMR